MAGCSAGAVREGVVQYNEVHRGLWLWQQWGTAGIRVPVPGDNHFISVAGRCSCNKTPADGKPDVCGRNMVKDYGLVYGCLLLIDGSWLSINR